MKRIYIAGPYSAKTAREVQANVNKAIETACMLIIEGWNPYIPHLSHYIWLHPWGEFSWNKWLELDLEWLRLCDALFYLGPSRGADMEKRVAASMGMPIYTSLEELP